MNITSGGATGSSQKVIVRGISSFSANQPLYVVDGVPIMNDFQGEDSFSNSVDLVTKLMTLTQRMLSL